MLDFGEFSIRNTTDITQLIKVHASGIQWVLARCLKIFPFSRTQARPVIKEGRILVELRWSKMGERSKRDPRSNGN